MLCNKCQIRDATVHFTASSSASIKKLKYTDLCQECFDATDFEGKHLLPTDIQSALKAGCRFCGGEPCSGGLDPLAMLGGIRKMSVLCKPCAKEYFGFIRQKLPGFGDPDLTKEQMATLVADYKACNFPAVLAELEKHMKEWVAKRKPPSDQEE
jgi:protein-arginine kinase activator protein McsA